MVADVVVLESFATSIASGAFLATAVRVRRKGADGEAATALDLFSLWWTGLSVYALAQAAIDLEAAIGGNVVIAIALRLAQVIAFCIGLWGLMYYVSFVLTGRRRMLVPLALVLAFYYGVLLFAFTLGRPVALAIERAGADLAYAAPVLSPVALTALFLVPPLIAAATYVLLFFFTGREAQRNRVLAAGTGTVGWLASLLFRMGPATSDWWAGVPVFMALASALIVMSAFSPQRWLPEPA